MRTETLKNLSNEVAANLGFGKFDASFGNTYVAVEPFHLDRYLAEQVFRLNNCGKKMTDARRFEKVLGNVAGRRLTYAELSGTGRPHTNKRQVRGKRGHKPTPAATAVYLPVQLNLFDF